MDELTAEQVREAIEANSWAETSTIREFNDSSWQAIADELNSTLGALEPSSNQLEPTRWHSLFGTPERVAQLIADNCEFLSYCGQCWIRAANCDGKYSTVLEWLRGDAE